MIFHWPGFTCLPSSHPIHAVVSGSPPGYLAFGDTLPMFYVCDSGAFVAQELWQRLGLPLACIRRVPTHQVRR